MNDALNGDLDNLTQKILASYKADARTQRVGELALPSRERIVEIVQELRQLVFPGYFGHQELTVENVKYHAGSLLVRLGEQITEQIRHCLYAEQRCNPREDPQRGLDQAAKQAHEFISRIPKIRAMLALDVQAAYDGDPAAKSIDEVICCYPGFNAVGVYRLAHELWDIGVPLMPRIMTEYAHSVTGCDIHPGAEIGKSFFIDHATGVVIGETTQIGDNVKVYQGVTLGARSFPKDERGRVIKGIKRHPTIEDNVTIYANATILGGETVIGAGATVGGNTFITESITADTVVVQEAPELQVRRKKRRPRKG